MARKEPTIQRSIAWPKRMYEAIVEQAEKLDIPIAAYIRFAVEKQLKEDLLLLQIYSMVYLLRWLD